MLNVTNYVVDYSVYFALRRYVITIYTYEVKKAEAVLLQKLEMHMRGKLLVSSKTDCVRKMRCKINGRGTPPYPPPPIKF